MSAQAGTRHPAHYKRTFLAELLLVTEIQLIAFLAKWAADAGAAAALDVGLLFLGTVASAFLLARRAGARLVLCGLLPVAAGLIQLTVSFGVEWAVLASFTVLILADMVANLILLAILLWELPPGRGGRRG
jgi:hypothetical protein